MRKILPILILLFALNCQTVSAQSQPVPCRRTETIELGGNLQFGLPNVVPPSGPTTFATIDAVASAMTTGPVIDSLGVSHTLHYYFFYIGAPPAYWAFQIYVDGSELVGGTAGQPVLMNGGNATLIFIFPTIVSPVAGLGAMTITPPGLGWGSGASATPVTVNTILTDSSSANDLTVSEMSGIQCISRPLDFDRDGIDDIVSIDEVRGKWRIIRSGAPREFLKTFGRAGDKFFAGDFTGDAFPDLTIYRRRERLWMTCESPNYNCSSPSRLTMGSADDDAVVGDFDGDLTLDRAVYRPSTGVLTYSESSSHGTVRKRLRKNVKVLGGGG